MYLHFFNLAWSQQEAGGQDFNNHPWSLQLQHWYREPWGLGWGGCY